jgi:hypothetical protein
MPYAAMTQVKGPGWATRAHVYGTIASSTFQANTPSAAPVHFVPWQISSSPRSGPSAVVSFAYGQRCVPWDLLFHMTGLGLPEHRRLAVARNGRMRRRRPKVNVTDFPFFVRDHLGRVLVITCIFPADS